MVPTPITEDYYLILEVEQSATPQLIVSSYRRLALKLHPDRNTKHDATEAFQRLGRAYETLNDETKRRAYDLIYPSIRKSCPGIQTPRPTPTSSTPKPGIPSDAAQIAAIQKAKQERSARWQVKKSTIDSAIFDLQRRIRQLQQQIKNLDNISAAEAAADARKNSWTTWFLSPIYKTVEESEEDKERKSRERQERGIEKDMKERWVEAWNEQLRTQERLLDKEREEVEAADRCDDEKIRVVEARVFAREARERQERERQRLERERQERERLRQERERQEREWWENVCRQSERQRLERERLQQLREKQERERRERERQEKLAAFLKRQQQEQRQNTARKADHQYTYTNTSTCEHYGWWPKVQGRTDCPNCDETWTYLLECPGCEIKRCPKCQAAIRRARHSRRGHSYPRARTPSPRFGFDYDS